MINHEQFEKDAKAGVLIVVAVIFVAGVFVGKFLL